MHPKVSEGVLIVLSKKKRRGGGGVSYRGKKKSPRVTSRVTVHR